MPSVMNSEDRARYGGVTATANTANTPNMGTTSRKRDADERREQGDFANRLLLQNNKGRKIPWVWHATHKPSKATVGCPDFYVGINAHSMRIEFKRDNSCKLAPEQEEFRLACEAQHVEHHVVYSAQEAIELVQSHNNLCT